MQLVLFAPHGSRFFLGQVQRVFGPQLHVEVFESLDAAADRAQVRQGAAKPAVNHIRHAGSFSGRAQLLLGLFLRANKQHCPTAGNNLLEKATGHLELGQGLVQVENMNPIALGKNVALHFGVPTLGLVTKMNPGFEQFRNCNTGQWSLLLFHSRIGTRELVVRRARRDTRTSRPI